MNGVRPVTMSATSLPVAGANVTPIMLWPVAR